MSKSIYLSKYTDKKVTAAQYLVDEIAERIAKKNKQTLPYKYWNLPEWNKIFRRQIAAANALLKEVDCVAIMAFLRSVKGRNITSLGLKKQIIAGAQQYNSSTKVEWTNMPEIGDNFIMPTDIEDVELDVVLEYNKRGESLWEKL